MFQPALVLVLLLATSLPLRASAQCCSCTGTSYVTNTATLNTMIALRCERISRLFVTLTDDSHAVVFPEVEEIFQLYATLSNGTYTISFPKLVDVFGSSNQGALHILLKDLATGHIELPKLYDVAGEVRITAQNAVISQLDMPALSYVVSPGLSTAYLRRRILTLEISFAGQMVLCNSGKWRATGERHHCR